MKLIQILVLVAAMAVAAAAQNTSSTSQNPGSNAKTTANQTQKKAASSTASKANPGTKSSQSSGNTQTSGVKLIVPKTGAQGSSATKNSSTAKAKGVSTSTGSSRALQTTSAKASSATKSTSAVKTPVLAVKPAPKPATKTKNASLAATIKKKAEAQKKNQVKIVPQKVASVNKPAAKETIIATGSRRDPFLSIIRAMPSAAGPNCSVGKRCLFIPELELKGIAKDPEGQMMAVVVSNTHRAYFLRENDQVFNGSVQRITSDSVVFREFSTDHLGRETAHEVVKKIPRS